MTTLPLTWQPLRNEAERLAREHHEALSRASLDVFGWPMVPWADNSENSVNTAVSAFVYLLADLTRPESRDHWNRWWRKSQGSYKGRFAAPWITDQGHDNACRYRDAAFINHMNDPVGLLQDMKDISPDLAALLEATDD